MTLPLHITSEAEISTIEITAPERVINEWSVVSLHYFTVNLEPLGILDPHTHLPFKASPAKDAVLKRKDFSQLTFLFSLLISKKSLKTRPQCRVKAQKLEARHYRQKQEDKLLNFGGWQYRVVPGRQNLSLLIRESLQKM